jgi:very-short-patch-repair endonuclease
MSSVANQLDEARRNELLDLTLRNPLISHRTLKSRGVEIIDERPVHVYRLLVEAGRKMAFGSVTEDQKEELEELDDDEHELVFGQPDESGTDESSKREDSDGEVESSLGPADRHVDTKLQTPYTSSRLQRRLLNTFYHARGTIQEEGINTLFLALGMLRWYRSPSADKERKAPILLVPVELNRTDVQGRFRLQYLGEEIGGNLSLKAFLDAEYGLDWPLPPDPEDEALDLQSYKQEVQSVIKNQDRWHIDHHAIELGFFSFSRFLMYEDLDVENWPEGQRPDEHPVLRKLLAEGFDPPETTISDEESLDQHLDPEDTYHVVDADSSQTEAVLAVKNGQDLVLQGPPGTGKSQTITNIIAEAIGEGKTVLFASEKMAALEVVKRNLDSVGLGDACLELHSHKTRKKAVLNELERTLKLGRPQVEDFSQDAAVMVDARDKLNTYAEAVNRPIGNSGVRPYDAYGELVQLRDTLLDVEVPDVDVPAMRDWSGQAYEEQKFLVEQVESHLSDVGVPTQHPFWGSRKTRFLPKEQDGIERSASSARETLASLQDTIDELADALRLDAPDNPGETGRLLQAAEWVADAPDLTGLNVHADAFHVHATALQELVDAGERHAALHDEYDDTLIPEAWDQEVFDLRQGLAKHGDKWYRWIFSEWRTAKNDLAALCTGEMPSDSQERVALADAILEAQRLEDTFKENDRLAEEAFGQVWRGASSDWSALRAATNYLVDLHEAIQEGDLPADLLDTIAEMPDQEQVVELIERLQTQREDHTDAAEAFAGEIELDSAVRFGGSALAEQPYAAQAEVLEQCREHAPRIQEMVTYNQLAQDLEEADLAPIRDLAHEWDEGPDHLVDAFRHTYFNALLDRAMDERPALERFSGAQHRQVVERFQELDTASLHHNRHELALKHYEQKPSKKGVGQMGVLLHEMGKKSRHMPIRTLMQRAGNAIQALKPVFMMSPMSVPKYLPPESVDFDLVVFDEASQVRPVDAFGSILRGDQTVVVGDNKQLPPTSFFDSAIDTGGDDFEQQAADQESILDLFRSKGAPEQMLRFHYRSKHESLIAVSNKEFYDNNLNVFPSPDADREETGLFYHHLPDTTYDRGGSRTNKEEARIVAERVMEHARTEPDMSLGVATFSSAQQEAIRDRLEYERRQDPSCEDFFSGHPDEPFFVKNLESVQGDQRDVIFISVGYGRDDDGKVSMNFGPLNQDGGERRLNVLTTRAKYRCEVFTNLKAEDIDLHRTNARGVEVLKEYLKFAETGELDLATPSGRGPDSPFEQAVADRLENEGYRVEHQVGVAGFYIDLAVVDPDRPGHYLLGIECDGATYHSAKMARVRDRTRQAVLESLGWTIHRIWSTDWFRNPDDQLGRAITAIERAQVRSEAASNGEPEQEDTNERDDQATEEETSEAEEDAPQERQTEIERAEEEEPEADTTPYETASLRVNVRDSLHEESTATLARWIQEVVDQESPVHEEVAM